MDAFSFEETILSQYETFCIGFTHKWLRSHNFTHYGNIWEDALQCARLGLLLYIRQQNITTAEDVLTNGHSPYWSMYKQLSIGILQEACAPCGVHRPQNKRDVKFEAVPIDTIFESLQFATCNIEDELPIMSYMADMRED